MQKVVGSNPISRFAANPYQQGGLRLLAGLRAKRRRGAAESGQGEAATRLSAIAKDGYLDGMAAGCLVAAGVTLLGALLTIGFLPAHPGAPQHAGGQTASNAAPESAVGS